MAIPFGSPPAFMGYVGFVRLQAGNIVANADGAGALSHSRYVFRALSADINVTQEITKPDLVDSRYDRTAYQLGPKLVDGSVNFPVVYEVQAGAGTATLFEVMYRYAVTRRSSGLLNDFNIDVKYATTADANASTFTYKNCIVNSFTFSVAQSDIVQCTVDLIGRNREIVNFGDPANIECETEGGDGGFGTTRIVTWNDARVQLKSANAGLSVGGEYIRTFDCVVNNDAERFYTLNAELFPQAIAPRKREVTGTVVLMGRHNELGTLALNNELNCNSDGEVLFGYETPAAGLDCSGTTFNTVLPNTIFEIETMSLTNDIFESTINYHSLPAAGINTCDPLVDSIATANFDYV